MNSNNIVYRTAGILIKDRRILVIREAGNDFFIVPGGKIEANENAKQALIRELKEEVGVETKEGELERFGTFKQRPINAEYTEIQVEVFKVNSWDGNPKPSEYGIKELRWIDSSTMTNEKLGNVSGKELVPRLKALDLID